MGVDHIDYVTTQGDTFDVLALDAYNNEFKAVEIIRENPQYAAVLVFNAGVRLRIPRLVAAPPASLPPWKR